MKNSEREAGLLIQLTRFRNRLDDLVEELGEAGLEKTQDRVRIAGKLLDEAKQALMTAIRKADD